MYLSFETATQFTYCDYFQRNTGNVGNKNLSVIARKYGPDNRKQKYELVDQSKKQSNIIFLHEKVVTGIIMDCRTVDVLKFKIRLGFNEYETISTKIQTVLAKIMNQYTTVRPSLCVRSFLYLLLFVLYSKMTNQFFI